MCWNCLQENHLNLPSAADAPKEPAATFYDETALLAYLDPEHHESYSWTGFADNAQMPVIVTYNILDATELPVVDGQHGEDSNFAFSAAQIANFRLALAEASRVAGVVFVETDGPAMIDAYGVRGSDYGGWANLPGSADWYTAEGILVIDDATTFAKGTYGFHTLLHELGHALGLKHPFDGQNILAPALDNTNMTVMSYDAVVNRTTYAALDVDALRHLYGKAINTTGWSLRVEDEVLIGAGSARNDKMTGVGLANRLSGLAGHDILRGRHEADTLIGGGGDDTLDGALGADRLDGGLGNDRVIGAAPDEIVYTFGDGTQADTLIGGSGNDTLVSGTRRAEMLGGAGDDLLKTLATDGDTFTTHAKDMQGGDGADTIYGYYINDTLSGGDGNDLIHTGASTVAVRGGAGDDVLRGWVTANLLNGDAGNDRLYGGAADDRLTDLSGNNTLQGGTGADTLVAGAGNDVLYGNDGDDRLNGGDGDNRLYGGAGVDSFYAADSATLRSLSSGGEGTDQLYGGRGRDRFYGDAGQDNLLGRAGADALYGGLDNDNLLGGDDDDRLYGGMGHDRLWGNQGIDTLSGGEGYDTFVFSMREPGLAADRVETITDFDVGIDMIEVGWYYGSVDGKTAEALHFGTPSLSESLTSTASGETDTRVEITMYDGVVLAILLRNVAPGSIDATSFDEVLGF